jgi:predicted nucleic acid-binding protein
VYTALLQAIDPGEAMSLAIAGARGWIVYTDDGRARRIAGRRGVTVGGTIGLLRRLVTEHVLTMDEANGLLRDMIDRARYRAPVTDLRDLS